MNYVCKVTCYHRRRLWKAGEIYTPSPDETRVPHHFEMIGGVRPKPPVLVDTEPPPEQDLNETETYAVTEAEKPQKRRGRKKK